MKNTPLMEIKRTKCKENIRFFLVILLVLLSVSCGRFKQETRSGKDRAIKESIVRLKHEKMINIPPLSFKGGKIYPWEDKLVGGYPRITPAFFQCNGSIKNREKTVMIDQEKRLLFDCDGYASHGLPLRKNKEYIFVAFIDILNYLQDLFKKKVVVTCGHRCPKHNMYIDASKENSFSTHQIGGKVSFYIQGIERDPERVLQAIKKYYLTHPQFKTDIAYSTFKSRPEKTGISAWYNKEIRLKIYPSDVGRNEDNKHPYPYISMEILYDRETKKRVYYHWSLAHKGYLKK